MEFRVLGPLEVGENGEPVDVGPRKQRLLLALLLIHANQVVTTDRILEDLWGDDAEGKERALWVHVSRLRSVLGGHEILVTFDHGYSLVVDPNSMDVHQFEVALAEGRALIKDDPRAASERLTGALSLWRGAPYEEFGNELFSQAEIARLEGLRLDASADRFDAELQAGESSALVSELESLSRSHPLNERFVSQLMTALHRSGRTADALAAYERARRALSEQLGIEPSRMLQRVEQRVLMDEERPTAGGPGTEPKLVHNLPAEATTFVGRDDAVTEVMATIAETRLLTLTGMGGVGKTRIALRVATDLVEQYPDGVWLVELASVSSTQVRDVTAQALASAIAAARGPIDELALALGDREMLLVLDNCEHVISACAGMVQQLLEHAPGLRILATSREPLDIPGEMVWPVAAMSAPTGAKRGLTIDEMIGFDAIRLFVDRARSARPGFTLSEENQDHVARICWRVDGIPLALELAAARVRSMTIAEIAAGLDNVFELLTSRSRTGSARHKTLQATLDWSFDLLNEQERLVLYRLTALHRTFPRKAAEIVCAGEGVEESDILDLLGRLVDTSWIGMEYERGEAPYLMLQTTWEFIRSKLGEHLEHDQVKCGWVILLAQHTDLEHKRSDREMWSALLDGDHRVVRSSLEIAYDRRAIEEGSFLAGAAAALTSTTGRLGFIGGVAVDPTARIERFAAGFKAGARHVDSAAVVESHYLSRAPDRAGFWDRSRLRGIAYEMYQREIDVTMHAAGRAGLGLSDAALNASEVTGQQKWGIGVDLDLYYEVPERETNHVLTSVRFQIPTSIHRALKEAVAAERAELPRFDLASNGVVLSTSGGHLDDILDEINRLRQQIIEGTIEVPTFSAAS